jgi:hypothetical protein
MARPLRLEFPHAVYHVTGRGNARQDIVADDEDRRCPVRVSARPVGCLSCMSFALLALLSCLSSRASVAFLSQCPSPLSRFSAVRR